MENKVGKVEENNKHSSAPSISLPKGGGAIRGIGEKFAANPVTGTGSLSVPIATSPGRSGFGPQLSLTYDSGSGNGPFGWGWNLSLPAITRKTDKGLPKYQDEDESDTFILSGAEDLVPVFKQQNNDWVPENLPDRTIGTNTYRIKRYRPRLEGLFARIERWTNTHTHETHWRSISKDNITTIYGQATNSRIEDSNAPEGSPRVFSWLICASYDDKGNAIYYEYQPENSARIDRSQINERNRTAKSRSANRYLKRIKYGNQTPVELDSDLPREFREELSERTDWLFEVVFDYKEGHYEELPADPNIHQLVNAHKDLTQEWPIRQDPFSSFRSSFEVRTYRLCQRVLMFHHFPDELGVANYLVRATEFQYQEGPIASFITSVTQSGFQRQDDGTYLKKSLPPLEFEYSKAAIQDKIKDVDQDGIENLPQGLDGSQYQWVDIDGEGTAGILTEQGNAWLYKRNISALPVIDEDGKPHTVAQFAPTEQLATIPSVTNLSEGRQQLLDLAGDGQLDVVAFVSPTPGFFERTKDEAWHTFKPFASLPNISWQNPNLKFVDLTGDGHADIFITEDEAFTWYQSLGEMGFAMGEKVRQALDVEQGPKLVFADGTQSIYLADISGDGLTDLVRIRSGEVCYWPNLGYGRFGAKVTMDNSPHFDVPDQFDQRRIRLADIDGSGVTDIIYLKGDGVYIYLNESGNRWANAEKLKSFPPIDNLSSVMAVDLLGNGTACLVWSSPLPGHAHQPMRYIDLLGGQKPHLLVKTVNNLGAETHVHYAPSTKFYLADKKAGKPWITRISFPVHVVERVETFDRISRNCFVTRYAYHHGYFDGVEREFRGFGMVEQWDTEHFAATQPAPSLDSIGDGRPAVESTILTSNASATNIDKAFHVPPVHTKTWFHTGAYLDRNHISNYFAGLVDDKDIGEYYREPGLTEEQARQRLLADTILPEGLTVAEEREACRALKGSMLRQEVYALDSTDQEKHPYTITEQNFTIRCLQPQESNRHAVFFTHPREAINYHYERNPADPRIAHAMTLAVDDFGNVLKEVAIGYGRRQPDAMLPLPADRERQTQTLITYTENRVTNTIDNIVVHPNDYRSPLPSEIRTYELTGFEPENHATRFSFDEWTRNHFALLKSAIEIPYEHTANNISKQKRLIEQVRILYRKNDFTALLPLGEVESLSLPGETYKLAFTPGLLEQVYQRPQEGQPLENLLPGPATVLREGGYVDLDNEGHWWIPSGQMFYSPSIDDSPAQELAYAQQHFFLPHRYLDPFANTTQVEYDQYQLLAVETRDALGNITTAKTQDDEQNMATRLDYRVLQPYWITDPNGNRTQVAFDTLGRVVATAVMGKLGENQGDFISDDFKRDLSATEIQNFIDNPRAMAKDLLKSASTRILYDLDRYQCCGQPPVAATLAREIHARDPNGDQSPIQISFSYSDGFGREIQKKIQAEPEKINGVPGPPRWVGSGWTIFNNKGKPVRQYEPFFSATPAFEFGVQVGVSPVLFYDPLARVVATLQPNHSYEKVVFDPWQQRTWDVNDTVAWDPRTDPDIQGYVQGYFSTQAGDWQTWREQQAALGMEAQAAANKALEHADTPTVAYFDTLGRPFLTVADNGEGQHYKTRVILDIEGNQRQVIDAKERVVMRYAYDLLGNRIHQASMEAGARWHLNDVTGQPFYHWDSRHHQLRTDYDRLRRPLAVWLQAGEQPEQLVGQTAYGESRSEPALHNLRGQVYQVFDGAGVITHVDYDFKGNVLHSHRQLAIDYENTLDWSATVDLEEDEVFHSHTTYDALNRPLTLTAPDNTVLSPIYNEANLLEQVKADLRGVEKVFVQNIDYDAKGQRVLIEYGNAVKTSYDYDPLTFRLSHLRTQHGGERLQDLFYTYDPAGNITHIRDEAQQTLYFNNAVVNPHAEYTYDALYRLITATSREHIGQVSQPWEDSARVNLPHPHDGQAMRRYTERYEYDEVGNFLRLIHQASQGSWNRQYRYDEASFLEGGKQNNQLSRTQVGEQMETYRHDAHGNMVIMPHLGQMGWDFKDQLQQVDLGGGGTAYYVYDAAGQRVRKVIERQNGTRQKERIYLGGFEVYREYNGDGEVPKLERETLHVMDDKQRVALVETRTQGEDEGPVQLVRYQLGNHLGSVSLELDDGGQVISYEEYTPYGGTAYQGVDRGIRAAGKRYRYTGMERDEETGLAYHGARYYISWVGRWCSCDPRRMVDGTNLYKYAMCGPVGFLDQDGTQAGGSSLSDEEWNDNTAILSHYNVTPPTILSISEEEWITQEEINYHFESLSQENERLDRINQVEERIKTLMPKFLALFDKDKPEDKLTIAMVKKLHPEFAVKIMEFLIELDRQNIKMRIYSGYRTPEEQIPLNKAGSGKPAWESMHQYGLAVDVTLYDKNGNIVNDNPKHPLWKKVSDIASGMGIEPSMEWPKLIEFNHFQYNDPARSELAQDPDLRSVFKMNPNANMWSGSDQEAFTRVFYGETRELPIDVLLDETKPSRALSTRLLRNPKSKSDYLRYADYILGFMPGEMKGALELLTK
jgi:RHS repeat-associated protein